MTCSPIWSWWKRANGRAAQLGLEPVEDFDRDIARLLAPTGYRILVRIPDLDEQMKNGLYMPQTTQAVEELAQLKGRVVALGKDAYRDKRRFPSGPYCEPNDFVLFRAYAGTHFKVGNAHYRLLNDDSIQAVIKGDPEMIERAM